MIQFNNVRSPDGDSGTGTYADSVFILMREKTRDEKRRESGHSAHLRDYSDSREVDVEAIGFA